MLPSAASRRRALRRRGEGGGVRDQMVRRQHQQRRARVTPLGDAGRRRDRRQRVARDGLQHHLDPRAGLARLVGDQEMRRRGAHDDRVGERPAGEPRDRALERRDAAHDRRMLLGEVAPRDRPQPRPRPAAEDRRHDVAGPPAGDADGRQLRHGRVPSASGLSAGGRHVARRVTPLPDVSPRREVAVFLPASPACTVGVKDQLARLFGPSHSPVDDPAFDFPRVGEYSDQGCTLSQ